MGIKLFEICQDLSKSVNRLKPFHLFIWVVTSEYLNCFRSVAIIKKDKGWPVLF